MSDDAAEPPAADRADRPTKQEQEPASEEITEVGPGILRLQLPVNLPGLGHVNCYAIEDERGVALVDPGLPGEMAWRALTDRLATAGYRPDDVHTTVVTHSHFDHFGAAEQLREQTGADILTHESFRLVWEEDEAFEHEDSASLDLAEADDIERLRERFRWTTPWGTRREPPPDDLLRQFLIEGRRGRRFPTPTPSIRVVDEQWVTLGRRDWLAVHTPGHTEDHLCLYDPENGVMLCGDHVLPTITPHISGYGDDDPLARFFDSLERMKVFDGVQVALPAHGHPFHDLAARAHEIIDHHEERLDVIRAATDELGDGTVTQYMQRLFRPRSWGEMAESETYAHLQHLRTLGEVEAGEDRGLVTFRRKIA